MRCKGRDFILIYKHLMFFCAARIGFVMEVTYLCKVV